MRRLVLAPGLATALALGATAVSSQQPGRTAAPAHERSAGQQPAAPATRQDSSRLVVYKSPT